MSLREEVVSKFKERRQRLIDGNVNSIPSPFKRFSDDFIGIEQGTYYLVTSYTKGGKSQFVSYLLYCALMFVYYNQKKIDIDLKILYFNLEETKEKVLTRFISWLLFDWTKWRVRLSPRDLMSSKNDKPLDQSVIDLIETDEIQDIIDFFESHVEFSSETNPTGIYKFCRQYAEDNGVITKKPAKYRDEFGNLHDTEVFSSYKANNPNQYVIGVVDTMNIIDNERGFNKKQSIDKLSEYFVLLRNRYNMSFFGIQQQNTKNESIENVKFNKTRPSTDGLGDSTYTAHDANIVLGIFSPFKFELKEYLGYPVDKFRDHLRFLEVLVNRDGELGGIVPLFFDGAVCNWSELPKMEDTVEMGKVYAHLRRINGLACPVMFSVSYKKENVLYSLRKSVRHLLETVKTVTFAKSHSKESNKNE